MLNVLNTSGNNYVYHDLTNRQREINRRANGVNSIPIECGYRKLCKYTCKENRKSAKSRERARRL